MCHHCKFADQYAADRREYDIAQEIKRYKREYGARGEQVRSQHNFLRRVTRCWIVGDELVFTPYDSGIVFEGKRCIEQAHAHRKGLKLRYPDADQRIVAQQHIAIVDRNRETSTGASRVFIDSRRKLVEENTDTDFVAQCDGDL